MIYFLSDAHLGSQLTANPHAQERRIVALLDRMKADATAIFLLGDIFDFWFEYRYVVPKGFVRVLGKLAELTDAGIAVHFFCGNHDLWTDDYIEKEVGLQVHRGCETLMLNGRRCLLSHGDDVYQTADRQFRLLRHIFHSPVNQWLWRNLVPNRWGMRFGLWWSKHNRLQELAADTSYKGEHEERLVIFAKEHELTEHLDYYIFGHRHIELDLQLATNARVVILGDCISLNTYAQMDEQGNLTLENF